MTRMNIHNGGFNARSAFGDHAAATAGSTGDATESNGVYVDREDADSGLAMSCKLIIAYEAVLAEGETLSIGANIQDANDDQADGLADYGDAYASAVVATGGSGGSTERGTVEMDFDLISAKQFLRSQVTPDLSAADTDTAQIVVTWVFFGAQNGPMSKSVI